jgi:CTP:molybdopterin cytidylyltransferase MocA
MRGRDKLLEPVDGQPLLRRQAERARAATQGAVFVTLPPKPHPRHEALQECGIETIEVADAVRGMSASLKAGIAALPEDAEAVMILLADMPDLETGDLLAVCRQVDDDKETLIWRGATERGAPGHPIVFRRALFDALLHLDGDSGGAEVVARNAARARLVPLPGERARNDLDTPEAWEAWHAARQR